MAYVSFAGGYSKRLSPPETERLAIEAHRDEELDASDVPGGEGEERRVEKGRKIFRTFFSLHIYSGWWLNQPIWKIFVKFGVQQNHSSSSFGMSHRIHGTMVYFTYMNGWYLWFSCRFQYTSPMDPMGTVDGRNPANQLRCIKPCK